MQVNFSAIYSLPQVLVPKACRKKPSFSEGVPGSSSCGICPEVKGLDGNYTLTASSSSYYYTDVYSGH